MNFSLTGPCFWQYSTGRVGFADINCKIEICPMKSFTNLSSLLSASTFGLIEMAISILKQLCHEEIILATGANFRQRHASEIPLTSTNNPKTVMQHTATFTVRVFAVSL